jgi:hypothetical protein
VWTLHRSAVSLANAARQLQPAMPLSQFASKNAWGSPASDDLQFHVKAPEFS